LHLYDEQKNTQPAVATHIGAIRGVNLAPSPWVSPDPLLIKPTFREAPNEGAKKNPRPQSVRPDKN